MPYRTAQIKLLWFYVVKRIAGGMFVSYFVGFQQEKVFPRYNFNTNYFIFTTLKLLVRWLSFKTQFKIEFFGPFNGPTKALKKTLILVNSLHAKWILYLPSRYTDKKSLIYDWVCFLFTASKTVSLCKDHILHINGLASDVTTRIWWYLAILGVKARLWHWMRLLLLFEHFVEL